MTTRILDSRIRTEHISKYGESDEILGYLHVLEVLPVISEDSPGENHHMLARSAWPEYSNLKNNPWNRLRVSYGVHTALTELQSRFDKRLRIAALLMKGLSSEAHLEIARRGGRVQGKKNAASGLLALLGKRCLELGAQYRPTVEECRKGGKAQGEKVRSSGLWKPRQDMGRCQRWNINRGKACACGHHSMEAL
jgi:hypothetical protein